MTRYMLSRLPKLSVAVAVMFKDLNMGMSDVLTVCYPVNIINVNDVKREEALKIAILLAMT